MRMLSALAGIVLLGAAGCSAPESSGPGPDGGLDYPAGMPGFLPGDQMYDLSFQAKVHGQQDAGMAPVKVTLADFYAMRKQGAKLLLLSGAAEWCVPCTQEASGLVQALADRGFIDFQKKYQQPGDAAGPVQIVQVILQKQDTSPADAATIDRWTQAYNIGFAVGIDPMGQVSQYIPPRALPRSLFIRLRDMRLLAQDDGYRGTDQLIADMETYLQNAAN